MANSTTRSRARLPHSPVASRALPFEDTPLTTAPRVTLGETGPGSKPALHQMLDRFAALAAPFLSAAAAAAAAARPKGRSPLTAAPTRRPCPTPGLAAGSAGRGWIWIGKLLTQTPKPTPILVSQSW